MKALKYLVILVLFFGIGVLGYMDATNKNVNELGLSILTFVKSIKGDNINIKNIIPSRLPSLDHSEWTGLLKEYVDGEGKVDYSGISKNETRLDLYLEYLSANAPASSWTEEEKMAYWINAYNAFTVKLILNHYPLKSIKDISDGLPMINSPWDIKFFKIGGLEFDLNTIEHEILRKQFDESRIHFAINCASVSCPKLRDEAYSAEQLDNQLEGQAFSFINDPTKNRITETELHLSAIFNWFEGDFTKKKSLHAYIKAYNSAVRENGKITYLEYDWGLNE